MALNGNLNGVLGNVTFIPSIAPVIKRSDGLYTIVDKDSIKPSDTFGTNLEAGYRSITDGYIYINILGAWGTGDYDYDGNNNKWTFIGGSTK